MPRGKPLKKNSITWWKKRLDKKQRDWFRETYDRCAMCKSTNNQLQVSHVLAKGAHPGLRYDPVNIIPLCAGCHRWKWHDDPLPSIKWFKETYPERHEYLQKADKLHIKRNQEYYQRIDKALDDKNVKRLCVLNWK